MAQPSTLQIISNRVTMTHTFTLNGLEAPLFLVTHMQLTIVTQSCTVLCTVTYCCSDAIVLVTSIVHVTLLFLYSI